MTTAWRATTGGQAGRQDGVAQAFAAGDARVGGDLAGAAAVLSVVIVVGCGYTTGAVDARMGADWTRIGLDDAFR